MSTNNDSPSASDDTESENDALGAGVEENSSDFDEADTDTGYGSLDAAGKKKRKKPQVPGRILATGPAPKAPTSATMGFTNPWQPDMPVVPPGSYPSWQWMQSQQMGPPQTPWILPFGPGSIHPQASWMMPLGSGSMPYPGSTWPHNTHSEVSGTIAGNAESVGRAHRHKKRKHNNNIDAERKSASRKAKQVTVKLGGEIDGACQGKNGWDDVVRRLVPRFLDISIVQWKGQKAQAVQKLRDRLDSEFEYLGNTLSMQGFRNSVKRFLKSERSRLKGRYRGGDTENPVHIQPAQWERLKTYWSTEEQVLKAAKMQDARSKVKNVSVVGRKGKAGLEALAGLSSRESERISAIERRQDDLDNKVSQVLACTKAHKDALDELKTMFRGIEVVGAAVKEKLTEVQDSRIRDRASPPPTVQHLSGRREAYPPPPLPIPLVTSSVGQPKPTSKNKESAVGEVPEQQAKVAPERTHRNPDAPPLAMETKGGAVTVKDVHGGATTDNSCPYSLEGAVDGLLKVARAVAGRSPKRQKQEIKGKTPNTRAATMHLRSRNDSKSKPKFSMGQQVWLLNPQNQKEIVAAAVVSGIGGVDKYHGSTFPESWIKVDVKEALSPNIPLMYPNEAAEQSVLNDAVGSNALWDKQFIKKV